MNNPYKERREKKNAKTPCDIDILLEEGRIFFQKNFQNSNIVDYRYDIGEAISELSLEKAMLEQLIEEYVIQILKSKIFFEEELEKVQIQKAKNGELDYTQIRSLAHQNLGVAKNLRIQDAQILLTNLLYKDDTELLSKCVKGLEFSALRLHPLCAYETIKLIEAKRMF